MDNKEKTILFNPEENTPTNEKPVDVKPVFDLGEFFKKTRLNAKISFQQLQEKSFVKVDNFERIEANDYAHFTDLFYLKMYIKEYAKLLEIDYNEISIYVDDLISRLDSVNKTKVFNGVKDNVKGVSEEKTIAKTAVQKIKINEDLKKQSVVNRGRNFELPSWIWIVLIILVLAIGYFFMKTTITNNNPEVTNGNETTVDANQQQQDPATNEDPAASSDEVTINQLAAGSNYEKYEIVTNGTITITLTALTDNASYEFCDDLYSNCPGTYPVSGTMKKDETKTITPTSTTNFSFYFVNPSAFSMSINGQEIKPAQQNMHFVITKGTSNEEATQNTEN